MTSLTISLSEGLKEFVDEQIRARGLGGADEYFDDLLRDARAREASAELEPLLLEGLDSGEDLEIDDGFWARIGADARELVAQRRQRT